MKVEFGTRETPVILSQPVLAGIKIHINFRETMDQAFLTGEVADTRSRIIRGDGSWQRQWFEVVTDDAAGQPLRVVA